MKKRRWRAMPVVLIVLGLLLAIPSGVKLATTRETLEYALPAPDGDATDAIDAMVKARGTLSEQLADCAETVAAGAICESDSISAGDKNASAAIYGAGEGWFEVYPAFLKSGRRISETELRAGDAVAMLDESLAFQLFGEDLNNDSAVDIGGASYRVVGTFQHGRSVGETGEYAAIVPVNAAKAEKWTTLMISARPIPESGARTMFDSSVPTAWREGGSRLSLEKEAMRRLILPRMLLFVFGLTAILALLRCMNGIAARRIAWYRDAIRWNYFKKTIPQLLAVSGICLAGYGAILALLSALMSFTIQPLYVFTEWVPDNFVAGSSLNKVFWSLASEHAALVRVGTPGMRAIEFEGGILRWGVISAMTGAILMRVKKPKKA